MLCLVMIDRSVACMKKKKREGSWGFKYPWMTIEFTRSCEVEVGSYSDAWK